MAACYLSNMNNVMPHLLTKNFEPTLLYIFKEAELQNV